MKLKSKKSKQSCNGQIWFNDLHKPKLPLKFALQNALLNIVNRNKKLRVDDIIQKACRKTGLDHFGDEIKMPFREPLAILLEDINAAQTTALGDSILETTLVDCLSNRLKIVQLVKENPEILDEVLENPVFIVGVPRSGTTHLHRALARCSEFRTLKMFELQFPVQEGKLLGGVKNDPRWQGADSSLQTAKMMRPGFFMLHEMEADEVDEEVSFMALTFQSMYLATLLPAPLYMSWHANSNKKPAYEALNLALKVIQWQDSKNGLPKKPFLLKSPAHLESLSVLKEVFPDAKLIKTHRSLSPAFFSLLYLMANRYSLVCKKVDLPDLGKLMINSMVFLGKMSMNHYPFEKERVINVLFDTYAKDNLKSIRQIVEFLEVNCCDKDWSKIEKFLEDTGEFKKQRVLYDPSAFKLDIAEVDENFTFIEDFLEVLRAEA